MAMKILWEITLIFLTLALIPQTWGSPTDLTRRSRALIVPDIPSAVVVTDDAGFGENSAKTEADVKPLPNSISGLADFESLKDTDILVPKVRTKKCFWSRLWDDYYVPPPPPPPFVAPMPWGPPPPPPVPFGPIPPPMAVPPPPPLFVVEY